MRNLMIPVFLVLLIMVAMSSLFIVSEGDRAIVIRFGEVLKEIPKKDEAAQAKGTEQVTEVKQIAQVKEAEAETEADEAEKEAIVYKPGLHFKIPFFDRVKIIEARIQTMDGKADRFFTSEQKDVIIDSYVKWKVGDFNKYYLKTGGDPLRAQVILNDRLVSALRAEIGSRVLKKIVSGPKKDDTDKKEDKDKQGDAAAALQTSAHEKESDVARTDTANSQSEQGVLTFDESGQRVSASAEVDGERDEIMKKVVEHLRSSAEEDIGIYVIDFRMKKINLPEEVNESIYQRMRTAREAAARDQRALGRQQEEVIRAKAELEVAKMLAEADKKARKTRGAADAEAAAIYAAAYNKDPEFYSFLRSLNAYQKSFSEKSDIMVLDPSSDFFKYMNSATGDSKK